MKYINPTQTASWKVLKNHFDEIKNIHLVDLFQCDKNRFKNFSFFLHNKQVLIDISKNRITDKTIQLLLQLVHEVGLKQSIQDMFNGEYINCTENRPVLHTALRNQSNTPVILNNIDIMSDIRSVLNKMKNFSHDVISGLWRGYSGKRIKNVVNIGIGGSDLGPKMVIQALKEYNNHLNVFYLSNIDSTEVWDIIKLNNFESTIFLISSKTFKTQETLTNARTIQDFFFKKVGNYDFIEKHFFAITANISGALEFGIKPNNIFRLWDWVGGRYSLWSAVGLSIMLSIGYDNFNRLLCGAYDMDMHFKNTSFEKNIPVLLALIGIWYNNFFYSDTEVILPYYQNLCKFPQYIQQSSMESNGKSIDRNGDKIDWQTGPILWGEVGTNAQHSFFQLIHQGTKLIPCDFIASIISDHSINNHNTILLSNFFAQTHALAFGKHFKKINFFSSNDIQVYNNNYIDKFKNFDGNKPSNSILFKKIDPYALGLLIALYEHKIFTQGIIFNIFSFDQWGVELGKVISNDLYSKLIYKECILGYDSSTNGLIDFYNLYRK
ncbi:Glucose-6-phosphate isomerase [Buchnera aphidicola (Pterocallis alni)]|uniref:glucose-6-phosphate isomerase n=1 Tax=Buchnera aphidicola TaxID=9 RepID=UPI003463FA32